MLLLASSIGVTSLAVWECAGVRAGLGRACVRSDTHVRMGLFDGLAAAFENDDTLGERREGGLSREVKPHQITWVGPKPEGMAAFLEKQPITEQQALPGTSLMSLAEAEGIPIKYSCMQGTCRICDVRVNGVETPACMAKMGSEDVTIEYRATEEALAYAKEALKAERLAKKAAKADVTAVASSPAERGVVAPSLPKMELPNPFSGGMPNLFAKSTEEGTDPKQQRADESNLEYLRRLREMEAAAKVEANNAKGGGGGWFS